VRYAASRHVRIVPEIEMPGHATAAIAAYPSLGSAGAAAGAAAPTVSAKWGVHTHLFNLQPSTFEFLDHVLAEVISLFPGTAIHVGGDEAVKDEWIASPAVQARARQLGIQDPGALQAYFTQRIGRSLAARGRRLIGWDEILRPGLSKDAIVMSWHGVSGAHTAAAAGNVALEDVYRFDPHASLSDAEQHRVLGLQANLWTEHMQTEARVQWMALPRAAALAEVGWSLASRRRWPDFLERLVPMFARYRALGLNYADSVFAPSAELTPDGTGFTLALQNQAQASAAGVGVIRYTLDGRDPAAQSIRYDTLLHEPRGAEIRAAAFAGTDQASRVLVKSLGERAALRRDSHDLELCSNALGLLLLPAGANVPLAVDIMNPCWIDRGVDLSAGPRLLAAVAALPFNYEIGADAAKLRVGDARSAAGELEIHADGCDTPALATLPLAAAAHSRDVTTLPALNLPRLPGKHDLCLRFARPRLDPLWALDWVEIGG
jgi:hexosaminidase